MNYFNYYSEIERTFIKRRGRNLLLSPLDWALIETWQERDVPLHIILRGIEKIFDGIDKQPARGKRTVKSLMYCREEIEAQYSEWLESQTGKNGSDAPVRMPDSKLQSSSSRVQIPNSRVQDSTHKIEENSAKNELFPDESVASHLEKASGELESAKNKAEDDQLRETLEQAINRLAKLSKEYANVETLEENLERLDALIDEKLLLTPEAESVKKEVEEQTANYRRRMEAEIYSKTCEKMLLKKLREQTEIPHLSLFYL